MRPSDNPKLLKMQARLVGQPKKTAFLMDPLNGTPNGTVIPGRNSASARGSVRQPEIATWKRQPCEKISGGRLSELPVGPAWPIRLTTTVWIAGHSDDF